MLTGMTLSLQVRAFFGTDAQPLSDISMLGLSETRSLFAHLARTAIGKSIELGDFEALQVPQWPVHLRYRQLTKERPDHALDLNRHIKLSESLQHFLAWLYEDNCNYNIVRVHAYKNCTVNGFDFEAHPEEDDDVAGGDEDAEGDDDDAQGQASNNANFPLDVVEIFFQQQHSTRQHSTTMQSWFVRQLLFLEVEVELQPHTPGAQPRKHIHQLSYHRCLTRKTLASQTFDPASQLPLVTDKFYPVDRIADVRRSVSQRLAFPYHHFEPPTLRASARGYNRENVLLIPYPLLLRHTSK